MTLDESAPVPPLRDRSGRSAAPYPRPPSPAPRPPSAPRARPRTSETRTAPPPRVTLRFEEYVAWSDAAGFGAGARSPLSPDWARISAWSILAVVALTAAGAALALSQGWLAFG